MTSPPRSPRRLLTLTLTLSLALGAGCTCGAPPTPEAVAPTPAPTPAAPADPLLGQLNGLRAAAAQLPSDGPERAAAVGSLVDLARAVGDAGLTADRSDVVAAAAKVAGDAGEARFAGALLQRATGLLNPATAGKDHLWALAQVRRDEGRVLEAVSLLERAVHVEPTTPAEWIGLSAGYLLADRVGPARAAITRGLRSHEGDASLRVQGAEVMLVSGRAGQALGIVEEILATVPDDFAARLVRAESLLVLGRLDDATAAAAGLSTVEDAWAFIIQGAVAAARGQGTARDEALRKAEELAGDCPCTQAERAAVAWARALPPGEAVTPRSRAHPSAQGPRLAAPAEGAAAAVKPGSAAPASPTPPR